MSFGEEIAQGVEVAERLRHLLPFDNQVFRVQPSTSKRFSRRGFTLCDFVLVVWKCQVHATRMDVERVAKVFHGHRRALDMPAGTAWSDARLPEMLAGLWRF